MNSSERLIDRTQNPLARELLRSADSDRAPENTSAKVALALGLGSTAVIATVATSAAASSSLVSGTGTAVGASAVGAGAVAAMPAAGAVAAMAPTAGAVTALGMLKVMAAVSLACGTLSYGGVKLALKVSDTPAAAVHVQKPVHVASPRASKNVGARSVAAFPAEAETNLPAPPPPPNNDDLGVTSAREQEPRPVALTEAAAARETNATGVGRHAIPTNSLEHVASAPRKSDVTSAKVAPVLPEQAKPAEPHAAAFPADDGQPVVGAPPAVATNDRLAPVSTLEREVAQLDHARAALASGQAAQALRELDQYRAQSPRGVLAAESVVLRVKALLALGRRAAAEAEAGPILLNAPQSRHAERLREILGSSTSAQ